MNFQLIARTVSRMAMILFFILVLAGCGDDAGDMDVHVDEPVGVHEEDEHEAEPGDVIATFDSDPMNGGFMRGESANFSQSIRPTSNGRYGFVLQRSGHLAPDDPLLGDNGIYIVDSGLAVEEHGDHFDPVTRTPTLLPYRLGQGGGEEGLYNPVHFVSHHGLTAIFYDGINPYRESSAPDAIEQQGYAVVYRNSDFEGSTSPPEPIFIRGVGNYSHGAVVAANDDDLFIVTVAEPARQFAEWRGYIQWPTITATTSTFEPGAGFFGTLSQAARRGDSGVHTWRLPVMDGKGVLVLTAWMATKWRSQFRTRNHSWTRYGSLSSRRRRFWSSCSDFVASGRCTEHDDRKSDSWRATGQTSTGFPQDYWT